MFELTTWDKITLPFYKVLRIIKDIPYNIKNLFFKMKNGFWKSEWYSFGSYHARYCLPRIIYLRDHPDVLKNEPNYVSSPAKLLRMMRQGLCPTEQLDKSTYKARRDWEHFHLETARAVGIEISIPRLHQDKVSRFGEIDHGPTQD